jgi:hypothetical protein
VAFTTQIEPNETQAAPGSPAYGHVDLLTVVTHELGNVLGFASIDAGILNHDWMTATLGTGVRRSPDAATSELPSAVEQQALTASVQPPVGETAAAGNALPFVATFTLSSFGLEGQDESAPQAQSSGVDRVGALTAPDADATAAFFGLTATGVPDGSPVPLVQERAQELTVGEMLALEAAGFAREQADIAVMNREARKPGDFDPTAGLSRARLEMNRQQGENALLDSVFSSPEWLDGLM